MHLTASGAFSWLTGPILWLCNLENLGIVATVAVGLGLVIFVHELGHFLVAKACGVKCDKFFIGFDIRGWKISRQWGETEYGIGILPLGGYVKMLGQDDNPSRVAEEMRRARIDAEPTAGEPSDDLSDEPSHDQPRSASDAPYQLDPRSYLAKSVPQRMAIISAGVIMNVIFAFVCASIAYSMGVPYVPAVLGGVAPGSAAYRAGLEPGDTVTSIEDRENPSFRDMVEITMLDQWSGDYVQISMRKAGQEQSVPVPLYVDKTKTFATLGIIGPRIPQLLDKKQFVFLHTPAADAENAAGERFERKDRIVRIDSVEIRDDVDLQRELTRRQDADIDVTVRRGDGDDAKEITIPVARRPMKRLGLVMKLKPIVAVQGNSPAAEAGLKAGDKIVKIADRSSKDIDPTLLADWLRRLQMEDPQREIDIAVERPAKKGPDETMLFKVRLRRPKWSERPMALTDPASAPALGIAIDVMQTVERVLPGSAADKAGIRAGDQIVSAQLIPEEGTKDEEENRGTAGIGKPIEFEPKKARWPAFFGRLQTTLPGTTVKLKVKRDDEIIDIEDALALEPVPDHYVAERGFLLESMERERKAESLGEALGYGTEETFRALTAVYRFLHKLGRKPEAATHMSGPIGIAQIAGIHAKKGTAMFLIFLTLISANLAVINFLPIPVLDGGHMVFLTLEAIMRRQVSEHVAAIFQWVGLLLLLSLMIFVFTLDISRLIG